MWATKACTGDAKQIACMWEMGGGGALWTTSAPGRQVVSGCSVGVGTWRSVAPSERRTSQYMRMPVMIPVWPSWSEARCGAANREGEGER